ncbi:MAG: hypothetical protein IJL48_09170 [Bacteroidales bacterium]|nr:hypothetical protein [Bacteroidales bacterium]
MDYISEAERLKLYYKGLEEAGSGEQIATAHPDLVSDHEESDDNAESLEADSFYLHSMLPLYYKLAYVYNNRFIHEDISLYNPAPQRVLTAKEIYDALQVFAPYAVPEIIRTIACSSATMTLLRQAFDAQDEDAFVRIIDTSDCYLLLTSCICEDVWPKIVYHTDPSDEDIANSLDVVASIFRNEEHPIRRSSKELSEATDSLFEDGDEDTYMRKYERYNHDLFDYMCQFYRDNYDRFKSKERKQIEPIILQGGGYIDTDFCLPDDYFSFHNEADDDKEYFGLHPEVIKAGVEPFVQLVNYLAEVGYIDESAATKQLFAYRFSGRIRPEKVEPIKWHGKNGNSYELIYLVRNLTERANYRKMRNFFTGPKWVKDRDSGYSRGADYHLKTYLHQLYPTLSDQL